MWLLGPLAKRIDVVSMLGFETSAFRKSRSAERQAI